MKCLFDFAGTSNGFRQWRVVTCLVCMAVLLVEAAAINTTETVPAQPVGGSEEPAKDSGDVKWSYNGALGPRHWARNYTECDGIKQSPIHIMSEKVVHNPFLESLVFGRYDVTRGHVLTMFNNGKAVQVTLTNGPYVEGGNLPGRFLAKQFHFHWGSVLTRGSEHVLDQIRHPMELHIVHFSEIFKTPQKAMSQRNGLAVLAFFFELAKADNPALEKLVEKLPLLHEPGQSTYVKGFSLKDVLPTNLRKYYRYRGSLTTPPCLETVIWTLYPTTIPISQRQLDAFRAIRKTPKKYPLWLTKDNAFFDDVSMSDNFRPLQRLNGRVVYSNYAYCDTSSSRLTRASLFMIVVLVFGARLRVAIFL